MNKYNIDILKAIKDMENLNNNSISFIFKKAKFNEGSLKGATITIKDLFATKEGYTQASSKILDNFQPKYNATVIDKINESGAAIVAKVHSDELGLGGTGEFSAYGMIKHPLDKDRIIGGSSSGSIASFTNNISFALATDTGDSVRLPASYNGFIGFKPSYGAISRYGLFAYASSLDTVGIIGREVEDIINFSNVIFGKDKMDLTSKELLKPINESLKPKKIAILEDELNVLDPKMMKQFNDFITQLKNEGIEVDLVKINYDLLNAIDFTYSIISFSEASSNDANLTGISFGKRQDGKNWSDIMTKTRTKGFGKMVQRRFTLGAFFLSSKNQEEMFIRAQKVRRLIVESFNAIYDNYDCLIFPSTSIAPLSEKGKPNNWHSAYLISANLIGNPSISIPFSKIDNMPYGINLDSKIYDDKNLLSYSLYIEKLIKKGGYNE